MKGLLAGIEKGVQLKKAKQDTYKPVSNENDLAAALALRAAGKKASDIKADAATRAEPLEHKMERLAKEIAREQKKLNDLKAMSTNDRKAAIDAKQAERDKKNAELREAAQASVKGYKTALTALKKTSRSIREELMGDEYDEEAEVTDAMKEANPRLAALLAKVLLRLQETNNLRGDLERFVAADKKSKYTIETDLKDSDPKLEEDSLVKSIAAKMKKLEAVVASYNSKAEAEPEDQKSADDLVRNELARLNKGKARRFGGARQGNAVDPLQQKIDKAVDMLAAAEELKAAFKELVPDAVDTHAADEAAEVIASLRKKLADAERKLASHGKAKADGPSSQEAKGSDDSDSEDHAQEAVKLRAQLEKALAAAGGVEDGELHGVVEKLRTENQRLVGEQDRVARREISAADMEKRARMDVESYRLAAKKLEDDAVRLQGVIDGNHANYLTSLKNKNEEIAALRAQKPQIRTVEKQVRSAADVREIAQLKRERDAARNRSFLSDIGQAASSTAGFLSSSQLVGAAAVTFATLTVANQIASVMAPQHALLSNTMIGGTNLGNAALFALISSVNFMANYACSLSIGLNADNMSGFTALTLSYGTSAISNILSPRNVLNDLRPELCIANSVIAGLGFALGLATNRHFSKDDKNFFVPLSLWGSVASMTASDLLLNNRDGGGVGFITSLAGPIGSAAGIAATMLPVVGFSAMLLNERGGEVKACSLALGVFSTAAAVALMPPAVITPAVTVGTCVATYMTGAAVASYNGQSR